MGLLNKIGEKVLERTVARDLIHLAELVKTPRKAQHEVLFGQLRRERETAFGRDHHFGSIRTLDDYRRHVPITTYEDAAPYIERVKQGDVEALFHKQKVLMFALTSGTTSARKFIPITQLGLDNYRRVWRVWGLQAFTKYQTLFSRAKMVLVSDYDEFRTRQGIPCGSISGLSAEMQTFLTRRSYCLPAASMKIPDTETKFYLAWRLGLLRDVGMWISPNPSTHVNMARFGDDQKESLIRDIRNGTLNPQFALPPSVEKAIRRRLKATPQRAAELEQIVSRTGRLLPKDVWPTLELVGCWMGGTLSSYLRLFPEYFGEAGVRDIGLIASEGRMTVPIEDGTPAGVLEISSTFYEFVPVDEIDSPNPTVLEAHELEEGRSYYILLTAPCGLYRYNIQDVVQCTGWYQQTPMLAFLNKGTHISSMTGEKLSEYQVASSVSAALAALDLKINTWSLAPCWNEKLPYYGLFVERQDLWQAGQAALLAEEVDRRLREANYEYDSKRSSRRLGPVRAELIDDGGWAEWDAQMLKRNGGTPEQFKHPCLIADNDFAVKIRRGRAKTYADDMSTSMTPP